MTNTGMDATKVRLKAPQTMIHGAHYVPNTTANTTGYTTSHDRSRITYGHRSKKRYGTAMMAERKLEYTKETKYLINAIIGTLETTDNPERM